MALASAIASRSSSEGHRGQDGAEDLLLEDLHLRLHAGDERRLQVEAGGVLAAGGDPSRPASRAVASMRGRAVELALGDQRAEVLVLAPGPIVTASSASATRAMTSGRRDARPAAASPPSSSGRRSGSAPARSPGRPCRGRRRRRRRWATCRRARARSARGVSRRPRRRCAPVAAEPTKVTWSTPACSASAAPVGPWPVATWIIPRGTPASSASCGEAQRRDRGQLGRLDDHRVAGRERGRGAARGHLQRVVPGDDLRAHAPGLAHRVVEDVRAERDLAAFEALDRARVVVEVADGGGDVGLGLLRAACRCRGSRARRASRSRRSTARASLVSALARASAACATRARPRARGGRPRPSSATCSGVVSGSSANSWPLDGSIARKLLTGRGPRRR